MRETLLFLIPHAVLLSLSLLIAGYLVSPYSSSSTAVAPPPAPATAQHQRAPYDSEANSGPFYKRLRVRKGALAAVLVLLAGGNLFEAAWMGTQFLWIKMADSLIMSAFWLVAIVMVMLSFPLQSEQVDRHWDYTVSLAVLTLSALLTTLLRLVIPTDISITPSPTEPRATYAISIALTTLTTTLQALAFYLAGTTDRCAPLYKFTPATSSAPLPISALTSCSPISYLLFGWISPVLHTGAKVESLQEEDLPALGHADRAETQWDVIRKSDGFGGPRIFNQLLWRILKVNKNLFIWQTILAMITSFLYYLPAFFLQRLVSFLEDLPAKKELQGSNPSLAWGAMYCLGLLLSAVLDALASGQLWFVSNSMLSTRIRVQLNTLVFAKTLRRKDVAGVTSKSDDSSSDDDSKDDDDSSKGLFDEPDVAFTSKSQVLNLFTIDVDRVADFAIWCFSFVDAPLELIIGTYFLYKLLGWAAFAGISVAVLFLPINHWTSTAFASVQDRLMSARDKRVSLMNEVLSSIRMLKYMAFEKPFEERILSARAEELKHLRWNFMLEVSFNAIWSASPILCVLVSFYCYTILMGKELTPSTAFASLAVWNELRFALNIIPDILVNAIQCLVSLRRIEKYLDTQEVGMIDSSAQHEASSLVAEPEIYFQSATVGWPVTKDEKSKYEAGTATPGNSFQLQNITARFPPGELSLVCGSLGSGKTLLLLALLGEADVLTGEVSCPRSAPDAITLPNIEWDQLLTAENWISPSSTAFVSQSAWLQNASIQDNICFGLPFRQERYQATLAACSLLSDLAILEDGDQTEIGEKGINLSGGQKSRVSLARAVYSRASLVLVDDCLAAVDAHTALHIFTECLTGKIMEGRTVVLVSHHVALTAPGAAYVVELDNGRVKFEGEAKTYLERVKLVEEDEPLEEKVTAALKAPNKPKPRAVAELVTKSNVVSTDNSSASEAESSDEEDTIDDGKGKPPRKLIEEEGRAVGRVSWAVWSLYLGSSGAFFYWLFFFGTFVGVKGADVAQTLWLSYWSGSYAAEAATAKPVMFYLLVYGGISMLGVVFTTMQWFALYTGSLRASDRLHRTLLHAILRAPLRFFDTQALGRIVNRFSKDIEGIDSKLPEDWGRSIMYALGLATSLVVITSVAPLFLVGFAFISTAYYYHARLFSKTAREFRRLDSISKSPLFSIYGEAVGGVTVIRAFGSSQRFLQLMLERCTTNVTFYWYLWSTNRWLSIRFSLLSAFVIGLTGLVLLLAHDKVPAALAGFALTFSLNISNDMLFLVRRYTSLELSLVAVERVKEYSELEQEAAEIVHPRPAAHWPHSGEIHVEKLSIRYAPLLPNVLHELDFVVAGGSKVGIVGATGCGKSTLALSFFRFVEAWSGKIVVDGIDIASVGLKDLRTKLTIIPQDPVILSGSLRSTLDLFGDYTDHEIFDALRRVHLIKPDDPPQSNDAGDETVNRSPFYNLDSSVSEGGSNFSQGERQLLCMARALLRRNRVILLDEATASVDYQTDELISQTIRSEFADSTLLVIAHRLRSVIDFDKILVLDAGRLVEYESPAKLLEDPSSKFYALCRASGKSEFKILKKMADGRKKVTAKAPKKLLRRTTSTLKPSGKTSGSL